MDGYAPQHNVIVPEEERIECAENFFGRIPARVVHQGSRAFYSAADDTITLPPFPAFFTPMDYYSARAHEAAHWTSRAGRCNRELGKRFGDDAYSVEELVAELSAAFVCAHLGLSTQPRADHAQYIASWLRVLRADKRAILRLRAKRNEPPITSYNRSGTVRG